MRLVAWYARGEGGYEVWVALAPDARHAAGLIFLHTASVLWSSIGFRGGRKLPLTPIGTDLYRMLHPIFRESTDGAVHEGRIGPVR
jgi:hypothetical protein